MENITLTPKGEEKLKKELEDLKANRKKISQRIANAKEMGDLKENAEYHEAKEAQGFNEGKIIEIETMLKNAIIQTTKTSSEKVSLGSKVTINGELGEKQYSIVGANEALVAENKISIDSPLAKAMLGKRTNDDCEFEAPSGLKKFKIISIS